MVMVMVMVIIVIMIIIIEVVAFDCFLISFNLYISTLLKN